MADGDGGDRWPHQSGPFSKHVLLTVTVNAGAIYTAMLVDAEQHFEELPYFGAREHADQLEAEGCFERITHLIGDWWTAAGARDFVLWRPTDKGREVVKKGQAT